MSTVPELIVEDHPRTWRAGLTLLGLGLALFIVIAIPPLRSLADAIDDRVWQLVVEWENDVLVAIAEVLDFLGSTWVLAPVMIGTAAALAWLRRWPQLVAWVAAMVVSQAMIGPMKVLYGRPRPPLPLVETTSFSFPSGHALATAAVVVALVGVWTAPGPTRKNLTLAAALFAVAMALSRVYLRAHWLSDVVAGAAMGAAISMLAIVAVAHWRTTRDTTSAKA